MSSAGTGCGQHEPAGSRQTRLSAELPKFTRFAARARVHTRPWGPDRLARAVSAACRLISRLSRGRLSDAHDEVLYVIRKPEDRFARVV